MMSFVLKNSSLLQMFTEWYLILPKCITNDYYFVLAFLHALPMVGTFNQMTMNRKSIDSRTNL